MAGKTLSIRTKSDDAAPSGATPSEAAPEKAVDAAETESTPAKTTAPKVTKPKAAPKGPAAKPSAGKGQNLQDIFLNHLRKQKTPVTMFLVKGVKLQGIVTWFDNFSILLRRDGQTQLVYKHAISTIMPGQPISLYEGDD